MRASPLLAALVLLMSGCTGSTAPASSTTSVGTVTDPRDYSYLNATPGSHVHDYWQGRDRVVVLDREGGSFTAKCGGCTKGMRMQESRPEEGSIVPQGTAWLDVTVTWVEEGPSEHGGMELLVKTARDAEARPVRPVESGVTVRLNSSNEENDPPHYVLSLWRFGLLARPGTGDEITFEGRIAIRVEAVRGLPLVPIHRTRTGGAAPWSSASPRSARR